MSNFLNGKREAAKLQNSNAARRKTRKAVAEVLYRNPTRECCTRAQCAAAARRLVAFKLRLEKQAAKKLAGAQ